MRPRSARGRRAGGAGEPAADAARLDERRGEEHDEGLDEHVAPAYVGELVGDRRLELLGRSACRRPSRRRASSSSGRGRRRRAGESRRDEVQLRRADSELAATLSAVERSEGILGERERTRPEHPEQGAVAVAVDAGRREQRAEPEEQRRRRARRPAIRDRRGRPASTATRTHAFARLTTAAPRGAVVVATPRRRRPR